MTENPKKLSSIPSPTDLYWESVCGYAERIFRFKARYPVLYRLWYRRWFIQSLPEGERAHMEKIARNCENRNEYGWAMFAEYHPILFLLWLIMLMSLQACIKFWELLV